MEYYLLAILLNTVVIMICAVVSLNKEKYTVIQCNCKHDNHVGKDINVPTITDDTDKLSPEQLKENYFYK